MHHLSLSKPHNLIHNVLSICFGLAYSTFVNRLSHSPIHPTTHRSIPTNRRTYSLHVRSFTPATSAFAEVLASASALEGHHLPPSCAITLVRRSPLLDPEPGPLPPFMDAVNAGAARQRFISKLALQHGVTRSALDAIWGSNKNGHNRAHDAHFDGFICSLPEQDRPYHLPLNKF